MPKYKKCPRCEINYILGEEEYCDVCKLEMKGVHVDIDLDEIEVDGDICPRCGLNYLADAEKLCETCTLELEKNKTLLETEPDEWDKVIEEEVVIEDDLLLDEPDVEVSLEELKEDEFWADEEEPYDDDVEIAEKDELAEDEDFVDSLDDEDLDDEEDEELEGI